MTSSLLQLIITAPNFPEAACAKVNSPDSWFPEKGDSEGVAIAKKICKTCPHVIECLQYALDENEHYGVWGATTYKERKKLKEHSPRPKAETMADRIFQLRKAGWSWEGIAREVGSTPLAVERAYHRYKKRLGADK